MRAVKVSGTGQLSSGSPRELRPSLHVNALFATRAIGARRSGHPYTSQLPISTVSNWISSRGSSACRAAATRAARLGSPSTRRWQERFCRRRQVTPIRSDHTRTSGFIRWAASRSSKIGATREPRTGRSRSLNRQEHRSLTTEKRRSKQGPHRCGPAHFPRTMRLRLPLPPAASGHAGEAEAEERKRGQVQERPGSLSSRRLAAAHWRPTRIRDGTLALRYGARRKSDE